ncbi:MAG TPA: peroxiredoxin [Solirubrobacteraceae bacterium]|jgi:peroxiredoxin|nr:peroxiredoxin [Solirubrobacteraceae bacterium]
MTESYRDLPLDIPVPIDDGAADHLRGMAVPGVALSSTLGDSLDLSAASERLAVVYVYPRTGVPGEPLPAGWDTIPGARGCTPQSCAFRDHVLELAAYGATVLGVSTQAHDEQREFAAREHIPYPLLSDSELQLARTLGLPTFQAGGCSYYRRLTFVAHERRIAKVFYPVFPPHRNPAEVLDWLADQPV